MKSLLLALHLACAGLWLGCVLTEVLFERALLGQGRAHEQVLARLHRRVDLAIELPALLTMLLTGGLLLAGSAAVDAPLLIKIGAGLVAIAANVICIGLVLHREAAAGRGDWSRFERLDALQHAWGAAVLVGLLIALGVGIHRYASAGL